MHCRMGVPDHVFSVYLVPRRTIAFERVLEEEGVLADVMLGKLTRLVLLFGNK